MKYKFSNSCTVKTESITYMRRALELAKKGLGTVAPNPMVGAVIIKEGRVIGEGFHKKKGGPHAEVEAVNSSRGPIEGSTLFCTLEPCCHTNKLTPPCTDLIIEKKIKKVFVACLDPNPEVAGKGVEKLRENGIEVEVGLLEEESKKLNKVFFKYITKKLPYIHLKVAMTLDGKMFSQTGSSKWITSPVARNEVHRLRRAYDAVWVGMNTVLNDDPSLNTRIGDNVIKENKKIVIGDLGKLEGKDLKIMKVKNIVYGIHTNSDVETAIEHYNFNEDYEDALLWLADKGMTSVLVEGGSQLISSLIERDLYDEMTIYIAPKLIGNGSSIYESSINFDMEKAKNLSGSWRLLDSNEAVFEVIK